MSKSTSGNQLAAANSQPPGAPGGGAGAGGAAAAAAAANKGASSNGSAPVSTNGPPSGANGPGAGGAPEKAGAAGAAGGKAPSSTHSNSLQHSVGRHAVLPNGVGTCVLSSAGETHGSARGPACTAATHENMPLGCPYREPFDCLSHL